MTFEIGKYYRFRFPKNITTENNTYKKMEDGKARRCLEVKEDFTSAKSSRVIFEGVGKSSVDYWYYRNDYYEEVQNKYKLKKILDNID